MSPLWPDEAGFAGVFGEGDPLPGEVIRDKYRLVSYSSDLAIAKSPRGCPESASRSVSGPLSVFGPGG